MTSRITTDQAVIRRLSLPALLAVVACASACGDPFAVTATYGNVETAFSAYALSGTPVSFPSAFSMSAMAVARPDGGLGFEFAFDLNAAGRIVLMPVKLVAYNPAGDQVVGIQKSTSGYAALSEAPKEGYNADSVTVVGVGEAAVVQAVSSLCTYAASSVIYSKLVIDSVHVAERRLFGRTIVNQNCGFRSFALGFPKF